MGRITWHGASTPQHDRTQPANSPHSPPSTPLALVAHHITASPPSLSSPGTTAAWLQLLHSDHGAGDGQQEEDSSEPRARKKKKTTVTDIGFGNFVYRRKTPFHPGRLANFLESNFVLFGPEDDQGEVQEAAAEVDVAEPMFCVPAGPSADDKATKLAMQRADAANNSRQYGRILRSKGSVWLATRPTHIGNWSQAGVVGRLECGHPWWIEVEPEEWPEDEDDVTKIELDFPPAERILEPDERSPCECSLFRLPLQAQPSPTQSDSAHPTPSQPNPTR